MQPHRFGHGRTESRQQVPGSDLFVPVVDAAQSGLLALFVQQVPDIVQQCRGDEGRGCAVACGEKRALQGVLALRDPLPAILPTTFSTDQFD